MVKDMPVKYRLMYVAFTVGLCIGILLGVMIGYHLMTEMLISIVTGLDIGDIALNIDINETAMVDAMMPYTAIGN